MSSVGACKRDANSKLWALPHAPNLPTCAGYLDYFFILRRLPVSVCQNTGSVRYWLLQKMLRTAITRNRRLGVAVLVEARAVLATAVSATELER